MKREQSTVTNEELEKQLGIINDLKLRMAGKEELFYYIETFGCVMN